MTMASLGITLAYFSPETTLPLASAIAAVLGFGLLVVRAPVRVVKEGARRAWKSVRSLFHKLDL
jgi:hypothetical protein